MHRLTRADFERRFRRIDMMITAHSVLRDRRRLWARLLTLAILGLSIVGLALAFVGDREVTALGVSARLQVWVGSISAGIFFLALLDLQVDWMGTARSHSDAAHRLAELRRSSPELRLTRPVPRARSICSRNMNERWRRSFQCLIANSSDSRRSTCVRSKSAAS